MILRLNNGQSDSWLYDGYERIHYKKGEIKVVTHLNDEPLPEPSLQAMTWTDVQDGDIEMALADLDYTLMIAPNNHDLATLVSHHCDDTQQAIDWQEWVPSSCQVSDECCEYELPASAKADKIEGVFLEAYIIWGRKSNGNVEQFLLVGGLGVQNAAYIMNDNGSTIDILR